MMEITRNFAIGIELGKTTEGSAIAVVDGSNGRYEVKDLVRIPPGTFYRDTGKQLRELLRKKELNSRYEEGENKRFFPVQVEIELIFDQTAVSSSVVNLIVEKAEFASGLSRCSVIFEGHHRESNADGLQSIPKERLISDIEVWLEMEDLKISAQLPEREAFTKQLLEFRNRKTPANPTSVNPWREQPGEELVLAVGLACWKLKNRDFFEYHPMY